MEAEGLFSNREPEGFCIGSAFTVWANGIFSRQTKSLQLRAIADVALSQRNDGSGTISFGQPPMFGAFFPAGGSWPGAGRYAPPGFDMIEQAKEVYDIIRNAQRAA